MTLTLADQDVSGIMKDKSPIMRDAPPPPPHLHDAYTPQRANDVTRDDRQGPRDVMREVDDKTLTTRSRRKRHNSESGDNRRDDRRSKRDDSDNDRRGKRDDLMRDHPPIPPRPERVVGSNEYEDLRSPVRAPNNQYEVIRVPRDKRGQSHEDGRRDRKGERQDYVRRDEALLPHDDSGLVVKEGKGYGAGGEMKHYEEEEVGWRHTLEC